MKSVRLIRIMSAAPQPAENASIAGKLTTTMNRAVVMGDSHGKHQLAAQILDAALDRNKDTATATELLQALAYRAELAVRAEDPAAARDALTQARALPLSEAERAELAETLAELEDIEAVLPPAAQP
ncbi:hypothetical protein AB0H49_20815 [Nocardia sp. NPDC050713]|uniref:hypothetical protein n=1 Tax=Nocardia sp. NPDC050713 TaxID=3154511 RepID=UPI0033C4D3A9